MATKKTETKTCYCCDFYDEAGRCHRYPILGHGRFPFVDSQEWCGEYKSDAKANISAELLQRVGADAVAWVESHDQEVPDPTASTDMMDRICQPHIEDLPEESRAFLVRHWLKTAISTIEAQKEKRESSQRNRLEVARLLGQARNAIKPLDETTNLEQLATKELLAFGLEEPFTKSELETFVQNASCVIRDDELPF